MTKPVLFRITNNLKIGGITSRLRLLLPRLCDHFDVNIATYRVGGILETELRDNGVGVHHIPLSGKWNPVGLYKLATLFKEHNASIVHTHSFGGNVSGLLAAAMAQVPVRIGQVHSRQQHWYGATGFRQKKQQIEEWIVHSLCSDRVLFPSQTALDYFVEHCPVSRQKLQVLYNGIDTRKASDTNEHANIRQVLGIPADKKIIGFVGRLVDTKGTYFALSFMQQLIKTTDEYCLVFVGASGNPEADAVFQHKAAELGPDVVYFAGQQLNPHPYYREFDVFFFPSEPWTEALPGTVLEAAAHGLPVLSRMNDAVAEIGRYYTGIHMMQDADNPAQVLEAIKNAPTPDPQQVLETFSVESMVNNTVALYTSLLATKSR